MRREVLIDKIAEKIGPAYTRKDIKKMVDTFLDTLFEILTTEHRIELRRFGTFELRKRPGRSARAPKSGKAYALPDRYVPFFRPSKIFKKMVHDAVKPR